MARTPRSTAKRPGPYYQKVPEPLVYKPRAPAPSAPPTSLPKLTSAATTARWRTPFFAVAGTFAFGIALYGTALFVSTRKSCSHANHSPAVQKDVSSVYDDTASSFDADIGFSEFLAGIMRVRKRLAQQCKGDVLEVSAGTGRNLGYYKFGKEKGVRSLTLVDLSKQMVDQAKLKWEVLNKDKKRAVDIPVRFVQGDAISTMPPPPEKTKGYDTIIQTMGLCSTPSPVDLLKNLTRHLNPDNEEARILLLEHGRSYYQWLNRILDSEASQHADQHGCWWNRDIGEIVEKSGLEIVRETRKHFGTTWIFELRPKQAGSIEETKH
ncbi:hypothetical protein AAFC00_001575 [Neodothiora populina]|uniref:S-adenosyl-L-methionine-dependent methyltransferase n=1 Tax=Neodothiora populina TaxID=2781224 RepID=A0ABR3PQE8_9PEZI